MLQLRAFREDERILYVDTEIADRALDLRVAEQDLHGMGRKKLWGNRRGIGIIVGGCNGWMSFHDPS